ncbi:hypothetical protein QIG19_27790, partial [Klebsiella pneumoniae]|nr:hypothetical protein [Klebsiella pneumoniae]
GTSAIEKLRAVVLRHPEVITVTSEHGRPDNGSYPAAFSNVELFVPLKPAEEWPAGQTKTKLIAELNQELTDAL